MKKYVLTIAVLLFVLMSGSSYSLNNFNYTGIALNSTGEIMPNATVNVTVTISNSEGVQYSETHSGVSTDQFGTYTVEVGAGTLVSGSLAGITTTAETRIKMEAGGVLSMVADLSDVLSRIYNSAGTGWDIEGNTGTTPGTNFIGTTDNIPFEMRVENSSTKINQLFIGANSEIYRESPNIAAWVAGNPRGQAAVDLQGYRQLATQVAHGVYSTVGGGYNNTADGHAGTVGGGGSNHAPNQYSTVSGGRSNIASSSYSTVGGGWKNIASGSNSIVSGGYQDTASGPESTVGGGSYNRAGGSRSTVGGGEYNRASLTLSTVGGGYLNTASGDSSTVAGGSSNTASDNNSTVSGGAYNTASGWGSTVGGGSRDTASGHHSTVAGGEINSASDMYCTVGGGYVNTASGNSSTVAGGNVNQAGSSFSTVGGGTFNAAFGFYSTVGGGYGNSADGYASTVGGGFEAKADKYGQNAYASGRFAAQGDAQTSLFVVRNETTNATVTYLYLNGTSASQSITLNDQDRWTFRALVVGSSNDGSNRAAYEITGYIQRNGGTVAIYGVTTTVIHETTASYNATAVVNGTALAIQVTGDGTNTMHWVARVEVAQLNY